MSETFSKKSSQSSNSEILRIDDFFQLPIPKCTHIYISWPRCNSRLRRNSPFLSVITNSRLSSATENRRSIIQKNYQRLRKKCAFFVLLFQKMKMYKTFSLAEIIININSINVQLRSFLFFCQFQEIENIVINSIKMIFSVNCFRTDSSSSCFLQSANK